MTLVYHIKSRWYQGLAAVNDRKADAYRKKAEICREKAEKFSSEVYGKFSSGARNGD